jgi:hypothetical protein
MTSGACWVVAEVPAEATLQEALASSTFQSMLQRSVELIASAVACWEVEVTLAIVGAIVGAGTGASVPPPPWALYVAFSAAERSFHRRLKHFSRSPLVRNGGRSGRCSRQNAK